MGNCNHYEGVDCWVCKDQKRRIEELEAELKRRVDHGKTLREQVPSYAELKALTDRLTSRGFEDLHHENTELRAQLDEVRRERDEWKWAHSHSFRVERIPKIDDESDSNVSWGAWVANDKLKLTREFPFDASDETIRRAALAAESDKGEPDAAD